MGLRDLITVKRCRLQNNSSEECARGQQRKEERQFKVIHCEKAVKSTKTLESQEEGKRNKCILTRKIPKCKPREQNLKKQTRTFSKNAN